MQHQFAFSVERLNPNAIESERARPGVAGFADYCDAVSFAEAKAQCHGDFNWYVWDEVRDVVIKTIYSAALAA